MRHACVPFFPFCKLIFWSEPSYSFYVVFSTDAFFFFLAQHKDDEYGSKRDQNGKHSGGPFVIEVTPKMTVEDLRLEIKVRFLLSRPRRVMVIMVVVPPTTTKQAARGLLH